MNFIFDTGFLKIRYSFVFPQTYRYFGNCIVPSDSETADIYVTQEEILQNQFGFKYVKKDSFSESQCLMVKTGNYLLSHNSCMFHGVLIQWKDMGILFSANSGVGKTTQYRLWKTMEPGSVRIINGDKPILEYDGNQIIGHSSPWNGKEQYGTANISVPLKAVVILEQGNKNAIERLSPSDPVLPLMKQFIAYPDNTEIIKREAFFLNAMLDHVPVWKLVNKGDIDSAILTRDTLRDYYDL